MPSTVPVSHIAELAKCQGETMMVTSCNRGNSARARGEMKTWPLAAGGGGVMALSIPSHTGFASPGSHTSPAADRD